LVRRSAEPQAAVRGKALVMGDDTRGFLATVRSLGRQGVEVHAAPFDFRSPALASRYIAAIHDVPPWMPGGEAWQQAMRRLLSEQRFDLVIPCDERGLLPLQRYRQEFTPFTRLAIPSDEAIRILFDKHGTRELAQRVGVAVARGRLAQQGDTAAAVLAEFGAPVVVKPRRSYTLDGLARRGRVHVTSDRALLDGLLAENEPDDLILESCFEGHGLGLSILAHEGRLLQAFEHHRVHERSGSSFYRVSAAPNPSLVEACAAIAAGVGYTGIAMFEFKRNAAGDWILLEVNARPWGSLPLPVALGVDFPYRWYRLLVEGVETPPVPYRVGVYGRNLLPDIIAAFADAEARRLSSLRTGAFLAHRMLGLRRMLVGGEMEDVFVSDDRAPAGAQFAAVWRSALARARRSTPGARALARSIAGSRVRSVARQERPIRVLFACQGNICRSPYAAALLRSSAREGSLEVSSAGMMPRPNRPVPMLFQQAAAQGGIDLAAHRSVWLDRTIAEAASLIVVFDEINRLAVADRYPGLRAPIVKLGNLIGVSDIEDPVDGDAAVAAAAYAKINRAVQELAKLLA
jgi:protein-tyrosine-phosphatase/predicted ATP-grasp superfamily ATP-dependent carboligase